MPPRSRHTSVATPSGHMQDVPGAFASPRPASVDGYHDNGDETERETTYHSLSSAVFARRAEYVRPKQVRIKVGTWNVAAHKGTEKDVGGWFVGGKGVAERLTGLGISDADVDREDVDAQESRFKQGKATIPKHDHGVVPGDGDVGLYVLGLQEVVDVSSAVEALRPYTDSSVASKWKDAVAGALPSDYKLVAEQQLTGLLLLIYAAPDVVQHVKSVRTTSVGTGLMNFMGNKGAVTARIVIGETTRLVFVNCHLAAGADKTALDRRNWDYQQIVSRTRFEPIQDAMDLAQSTGEQIGDEDFAFWCGDLNYRLEGIPGDDVRRILMLHTRNEYDLSQPSANKIEKQIQESTDASLKRIRNSSDTTASTESPVPSMRSSVDVRFSSESTQPSTILDEIEASEDPASLQTTLSSLLPHDELHQQMKAGKAFHDGWREGPITFLPTYKYDPGSVGVFDSSEKKRAPSWCDRVLFRTRKDKLAFDARVRDEEAARKKDAEMKANGTDMAANDEEILYDYDPETDGDDGDYDEYDEYNEGDTDNHVVTTREGFEDEIQLEHYTAHQRVLSSDHKPLDAMFLLKYDAVIPELKAKVHAEVAKELDKAENEGRPNVTVVIDRHPENNNETSTGGGVFFGEVRWGQSKHRTLTVANTSRVAADFSFIERPVGDGQLSGIAPSWLQLKINDEPQDSKANATKSFSLEPGETALVDLSLEIQSMTDVQELNNGKNLEDILVLRVENGRDHFIPVRAIWLQSSLGRTIDKLIRIPEGGIRRLQRQQPEAKSGEHSRMRDGESAVGEHDEHTEDTPVCFSAPRELFRLTEAVEELATRVVAEWEMTNPAASPALRESLDRFSSEISTPPPWYDIPAWPFDESAWSEREAAEWRAALSEACNALDEDQALDPALPADFPRLQRLYVLSCLLIMFLRSMPEGVITPEMWSQVETYLLAREKSQNAAVSLDDQRTALQEILAQRSPNSITFVLITSMLERIVMEIPDDEPVDQDTALSPTQKLKKITALGKSSSSSRQQAPRKRQAAIAALAKLFAEAMIRTPPANGGDKARSALERRKAELIELFIKRDFQHSR